MKFLVEGYSAGMRGLSLLLGFLSLISVGAEDDEEIVDELGFSRAPYVQLATTEGIHVIWRTVEKIEPVVKVGLSFDDLSVVFDEDAVRERKVADDEEDLEGDPTLLHSGPEKTRQFEAALTDLQPNTRYFYAVYDEDERLTPKDESYYFDTLPEFGTDKDAYFWVVGDSGTGQERQSEVHEAMLDYTKKVGRPIDFYLHVGDMAYSKGTDDQFQRKFFEMYEETIRNTVVWPAIGNHEAASAPAKTGTGPYYDAYVCPKKGEAGGVASGHESYYSFDYGKAHFVVLNSFDMDRKVDGAMASWLKEDLSRVKADWLVGYWHHPPYSKGTHDTDKEEESIEMREQIMPILESHGVDLVLTGHSHIYERSMLMDGAYSTPTTVKEVILDDGDGDPDGDGAYRKVPGLEPNQGTIQVVAGHGGTGVGREGTMPVMKRIIVENGSVLVSIKGNVLDAVMINFDGEERDHFQLRKEPGVVVKRVEDPVVLPPYVPPGKKLPRDYLDLIPQGDEWAYHMTEGVAPLGWAAPSYDDSGWSRGKAGFGFGDEDDETVLSELPTFGDRLYVRRDFDVPQEMNLKQLGLGIRYDDAFIAYVNGKEILRQGVGKGRADLAEEIGDHEAEEDFEYFALEKAEKHLKVGRNVVAIECHSIDSDEGDFTLDPFLLEELDSDLAGGESPPLVSTEVTLGENRWRYTLEQEFEKGWATTDFDDSKWKRGRMPMGYGKRYPVRTSLRAMEKEVARVRFRRSFPVDNFEALEHVGLIVSWDDGFIAYLNGHELGRAGVARGAGETAIGLGHTGAPLSRYFPFSRVKEHLVKGRNILAIEGHNREKDSSDYYMGIQFDKAWPRSWKRIPRDHDPIIDKKAKWEFLAGEDPDKEDWTTGEGWDRDRAPFGYGLGKAIETELEKMKGRHPRFYMRRRFDLEPDEEFEDLGLLLAWDDAVIGYLNGREIVRIGVEKGRGAKAEGLYKVHGIPSWVYIPLATYRELFRVGENQLAFEGHNRTVSSSDFVLSPMLVRVDLKAQPYVLPKEFIEIIPKHSSWKYHVDKEPEGDWTGLAFAEAAWKEGEAGFGYEDEDDRTELDMEGHYTTVYLRKDFRLNKLSDFAKLGLGIRWDDGFIAYLNGKEIIRQNVKKGSGKEAKDIRSGEASDDYIAFKLEPFASTLREGRNVIAIEGHNSKLESSDFTLDPFLFSADWPGE